MLVVRLVSERRGVATATLYCKRQWDFRQTHRLLIRNNAVEKLMTLMTRLFESEYWQ